MKFRFWGCRGSIPVPGPSTLRYGGNTTCIEVRTDAGDLIILDAGTGIFPLARSLLAQQPLQAHILNTHSHWDHIHGLPFFLPVFARGNLIRLYGAYDPVRGAGPEQIVAEQLQYSFFPVREAEIRSGFEYVTLKAGQGVTIGSARVTPVLLNHPAPDFGYRIDADGKSLFFTGDHEPHQNIYAQGEEGYDACQAMVEEQRQRIVSAIAGVDALIADATYTAEEYGKYRGWGHGTFDTCIELARQAGAKALYCTHHEPTRSDDELEREFERVLTRYPRRPGDPEIRLAYEGLQADL